MACDHKAANKWTARVIPVILIGVVGYAAWVLTELICVEYLLQPSQKASLQRRPAAAIVVLVLFYLLLLAVLVCYGRLIQTIITNPGYTPRGPLFASNTTQRTKPSGSRRSNSHHRRRHHHHKSYPRAPDEKTLGQETSSPPKGSVLCSETTVEELQDFWRKDIFTCNFDGRPNWCSICMNFKTDRTHHCRETDRCVRKMDHFCPWVGGIISETSFKYFIQFTTYAAVCCTHILITTAILVAERKRKTNSLNLHWCIVLGLSALFLLFSAGMSLSSLQLAFVNSTTVENLSRKTKIWYLAVLIPRPQDGRPHGVAHDFMTITYPRPLEEQQLLQQQYSSLSPPNNLPRNHPSSSRQVQNGGYSAPYPSNPPGQMSFLGDTPGTGNISPPISDTSQRVVPYVESRTFAILQSQPGQNPFDLGPLDNLKEVLGYDYVDWFLPLKPSPCTNHISRISTFKIGEVVEEMKRKAGLTAEKPRQGKRCKRRSKREAEAGRANSADDEIHRP